MKRLLALAFLAVSVAGCCQTVMSAPAVNAGNPKCCPNTGCISASGTYHPSCKGK